MILHLLRHAKTEQFSKSGKDFDRHLMSKGIKQTIELELFFLNKQLDNVTIHVSSAKRTIQTAQLVFPSEEFDCSKDLYLAGAEKLFQYVCALKSTKNVFLIGHNDGLSELASYLSGENIHLRTAEYLAIEFSCKKSSEISMHTGTIIETFRPQINS